MYDPGQDAFLIAELMAMAGQDKIYPRYFRLVCASFEVELVEEMLWQEGYRFSRVQGIPWARELYAGPRPLGSSLAALFGLIYIQDKASLLPAVYLDPSPGSRVLDLCASPGGKAGFLAQLNRSKGLVLANEPHGRRYELLRRNMARLNLYSVVCCAYQAQSLPLGRAGWPRILLDVPCSGWGTAEKNPRVLKLWQGKKLEPLLSLQQELLSRAFSLLAPGGSLIYSTCTTNVLENELQVLWAGEHLGLKIDPLPEFPGYAWDKLQDKKAQGCLRIDGPASGCQSFFLARLRKPASADAAAGEEEQSCAVPAAYGLDLDRDLQNFPGSLHRLPAGRIYLTGKKIYFQTSMALQNLPQEISRPGFYLGQKRKKQISLWPRARVLLPQAPDIEQGRSLHVQELHVLHKLLAGQSLSSTGKQHQLGLYWRDLPLAWLAVKGNRILWTEKG